MRGLLEVGGRSPGDCVFASCGFSELTVAWRVHRVSLLLKLLHSPIDSLQHAALLVLKHFRHPWYTAALNDLRVVLPGVDLIVGTDGDMNFVYSTCIITLILRNGFARNVLQYREMGLGNVSGTAQTRMRIIYPQIVHAEGAYLLLI